MVQKAEKTIDRESKYVFLTKAENPLWKFHFPDRTKRFFAAIIFNQRSDKI